MNKISALYDQLISFGADFIRVSRTEIDIGSIRKRAVVSILIFYLAILLLSTLAYYLAHQKLIHQDYIALGVSGLVVATIISLRWMNRFFWLWLFLTIAFNINISFTGLNDRTGSMTSTIVFLAFFPIQSAYFAGRNAAIGAFVLGLINIGFLYWVSLNHAPITVGELDGGVYLFDMLVMSVCAMFLALIIALKLHDSLIRALDQSTQNLQAAEKAQQEKARLHAIVNHEIRNSLNGMYGQTALLLQEPLSKKTKDQIESIQGTGTALISALNDSLEISRLGTEENRTKPRIVSMNGLLENLVTKWLQPAHDKGLTLDTNLRTTLGDHIIIDEVRLMQILDNLISNAIKFTEQGGVLVDFQTFEDESQNGVLLIRVADSGSGIHPSKIDSIFEPFRQEKAETFATHGGSGLGLYICNMLAELLDGQIRVESSDKTGSVFEIKIPVGTPTEEEINRTLTDVILADLSSLRILAVDDHLGSLKYIETLLRSWGVEPVCTMEIHQALQHLRTRKYDVLLVDMNMPEMSGLEFLKQVRAQNSQHISLKTIAITGENRPTIRDSFEALGTTAFIVKPIIPELLYESLVQIVAEKHALQ